jgi:hypothetical protein
MRAVLAGLLFVLAATGTGRQALPASQSKDGSRLQVSLTASVDIYAESPSELITFRLKNGTQIDVECRPETWALMIDGKAYAGSGMLFGNGPGTPGGPCQAGLQSSEERRALLKPGAVFEKTYLLALVNFFPENRDYKVAWRAAGFESNTAIVHGFSPSR